jgi:hypothetical protein
LKSSEDQAPAASAGSPVKSKYFSEPVVPTSGSKRGKELGVIESPKPKIARNRVEVDLTDNEQGSQSQNKMVSSDSIQEVTKSPSRAAKPDDSVKLQTLNKAVVTGKLTAVKGGANAYFGGPDSVPAESKDDKTIVRTASSPVKATKSSSFVYRGGGKPGALSGSTGPTPEGVPGSLDGLKIAVTGVMESVGREQLEVLIMVCGGKVGKILTSVGVKLADSRCAWC